MSNQQTLTFAVVHGEAVAEAPSALYIPPAAMRVVLDDFEGPLDLLLFLVRKHKFDILDIQMTSLCRQYSVYVEEIVQDNLELAADYLTMSALLIQIKTKMMLPRPPAEETEEDDPRADLVRRLLEYEQIRESAQAIGEMPRRGRDFSSPRVVVELPPAPNNKPRIQSSLLAAAFSSVLARKKAITPYNIPDLLVLMSVREMMSGILRRLTAGVAFTFRALLVPKQGGVTFLALLQLAQEQDVFLQQKDEEELYVRLRGGGQ